MTFNGQALTPSVVVKDGETTLTAGTDYSGNQNAGTATATITGQVYDMALPQAANAGKYKVYYEAIVDNNHTYPGSFVEVTVAQAELTALELAETTLVCNRQEQEIEVASVMAGLLTADEEGYEISGNKATEVGTYTVTVTGKGNFKGTLTAEFTIVADRPELGEATAKQAAIDEATESLKTALQNAKAVVTGVNGELRVENGEMATATWYTLDGRKLDKMPAKKGVFIKNGKMVVMK